MVIKLMFDFKTFLLDTPERAGVYQMLDAEGFILYIGKAKNLKNRLSSYKNSPANDRISIMVSKISSIILTITQTEEEALLLENHLIKSHRPPYNILLKDDKSYPYIVLTDHIAPRLMWYRGKKHNRWTFFGPYPSVELARTTLDVLMKVFLLRSCSDTIFSNRTRPCLNYQIKQCSAPCVNIISAEDYKKSVHQAVDFLTSSSSLLVDQLEKKMISFSISEQFEQAKEIRDHIKRLRSLQRNQRIDSSDQRRIDVLACALPYVHQLMVVDGKIQGSQFVPVVDKLHQELPIMLEELMNRLYDELPAQWIPDEIIMSHLKTSVCIHGVIVTLRPPKDDREHAWLKIAMDSLLDNSSRHKHKNTLFEKRFDDLMNALQINDIKKIDCIDISHHQGDQTVGAIVHCSPTGFIKNYYRRYTIQHEEKLLNNDVYSMHQTLVRHLTQAQKEERLPDLLLVDGGITQLHAALQALDDIGCQLPVIAIAKGPARRAGEETLFRWNPLLAEAEQLALRPHQPGFLLLQQIRDETHRFVITWQKKRQVKKSLSTPLDEFKGLSSERKVHLLRTFGGWQGLIHASLQQLLNVDGIGLKRAEKLLKFLRQYQ
jgi:excinuclease ABC subunit C